ncbi:MAG: NmrA family NAD(P)-binding protein [Bacteroidota bacterium]
MKSNILVIGGTGKTGRRVVEKLNQLGQNVRIGSRSENPSFDWNDPSTYAQALKGMDMAYIVYYPDLAVPGAKEAIDSLAKAAKAEGLKKVVLLSGKGEKEAELCEKIISDSGLNYTIVRASWFSQNFSEGFFIDPILAGHVALPMAEVKVPFVDVNDIAEMVVEALMDDQHNGRLYELTGPRAITFKEAIAEISRATGRDIGFREISMEEYNQQMKAMQVPDDFIWLINYLFTEVFGSASISEISTDIEKVLKRPATDFSDYAQCTAETGAWTPVVNPL